MKNDEIIGMIKSYVKKTLVGMGALKGAPCEVQGVVDAGDGTQTLTLQWKDTAGVTHTTDITLPAAIFAVLNPTNGQTLRYNSVSGKFENSNVSFSADLGDLDDVVITSVQNGQVLTYDAANNRWINADGSTVGDLSDLDDVVITTAQNGQLLSYNGTTHKWVNISLNIDDLGKVSITSATDGQVLTYDAANDRWINANLPEITVDSALDTTSENPVQNKVIALALDQLSASKIGYDGTASGLAANKVQGAIDELASEKVNQETGKGLSTNDFTDALKNKLDGIEDNAEVNDIDTVKVNGTALTPDANKAVNIELAMDKLSDVDLTDLADEQILIYDATAQKWISGANTGATYTAGEGIEIDQNNVISSKMVLFTGTEAQWAALPLADKKKFTHYATNDDQTGQIDPVPTQNSNNLMTSGGIYTALQGKANTSDLGTAAAKDSTNAVTQSSTDLVEGGAVYTALDAKTDKVTGATENNFAGLDSNGNLQDSGKKASDFATAEGLANEAETRAKLGAHNLLNIINSEINVSGTYTEVVNSDGTVTIGGTPTSACTIPYKATDLYNGSVYNFEPSTNYVFDTGLSDISPLYIQVFTKANASASWTKIAETTSNTSLSFTTPSSFYDIWARILVSANAVVPANTVVKPQIRLATDADTTYRPYVPTNAELLSYKDNGVLGAKNLLNIDSGTVSNCSLANNGFTNNNTDARDFFNFTVKALNSSSTLIDTMAKQAITDAGEYSFDVTIPDNTAYILVQHVGSTRNIQISVPSSLKAGNYIFSFKVQSANPTTVGGLDVRNIMIRLATDTDPTYAPYAMTNRELTEVEDITSKLTSSVGTLSVTKAYRNGKNIFAYGILTTSGAVDAWGRILTLDIGLPFKEQFACFAGYDYSNSNFIPIQTGTITNALKVETMKAMASGVTFRFCFTAILK